MRRGGQNSREPGYGWRDHSHRRRVQPTPSDDVLPDSRGGGDEPISEAVTHLGYPLVISPVTRVRELDGMVVNENELSLPTGRHASHARGRKPHEVGVHLASDQRVRLLRTKITDKARDRARRPIDTEAVNAD